MRAIISPSAFCQILKKTPLSRHFITSLWGRKKIDNGQYNIVEPGNVSPTRIVPDFIIKPSYYKTGEPQEKISSIELKTQEQISKMRTACTLSANILSSVEDFIKVGVTTDDIDALVHDLAIKNNSYPSPLLYKGFPKSVCTSVNNVACHGIPDDRKLEDGDIINVDITVYHNGYHGDCSKTFLVGEVDVLGRHLVKATEACLNKAISICKPGCKFTQIGNVIQDEAKKQGFNVVPAFIGHGIGQYFHGPPDIFHIRNYYPGEMRPGMTFTIEPVLSCGSEEIVILEDGWTAVTFDCARTAQFEHTVLITDTAVEILTLPQEE